MRFSLRHDERRADPPPVKTNDRLAWIIGLVVWAVALVALFVVTHNWSGLWTCVAGLVLGVLGLVYTEVRTRRG